MEAEIEAKRSHSCQFEKQFDNKLFTPEAINRQFNNELQRQIDGTLSKGHVYKLGRPGKVLSSVDTPNYPIELKATILNKKANDPNHQFNIRDVENLPKAINSPLAIFSYGDASKMINVITEISKGGKNFLVGISLNPVVGRERLQINNIRNVFPKDTIEWVNWINQGKGLYFNEAKVLSLLDQRQMISSGTADVVNRPADVAFGLPAKQAQQEGSKPKLSLSESDIRSAANIVRSFNPANNIYDSAEKINQKNSNNNKIDANIEPI